MTGHLGYSPRLRLAGSGPKRQYFDLYNVSDYGITVA